MKIYFKFDGLKHSAQIIQIDGLGTRFVIERDCFIVSRSVVSNNCIEWNECDERFLSKELMAYCDRLLKQRAFW